MVLTKGDLGRFTIKKEAEYGRFAAAGAAAYGGKVKMFHPDDRPEWAADPEDGARTARAFLRTANEYSLRARFTAFAGGNWKEWLTLATGSADGMGADLPSFSARCDISRDNDAIAALGCKVNTLTIESGASGAITEFSVDAMARYICAPSDDDVFLDEGGAEFTFPKAAYSEGPPVVHCNKIEWDPGDSWETITAKTWTLSIGNNLTGEPSALAVGDACRALAAGTGAVPGEPDVTLTFTVPSSGVGWDAHKLGGLADFGARITLDGTVITLKGCRFDGGLAERTNDRHDETIAFKAADVSWA